MSENETKSQSGSDEKAQTASVQEELVKEPRKELDLVSYHEHNAGRLVVDPQYVWVSYATLVSHGRYPGRRPSSSAKRSPASSS